MFLELDALTTLYSLRNTDYVLVVLYHVISSSLLYFVSIHSTVLSLMYVHTIQIKRGSKLSQTNT